MGRSHRSSHRAAVLVEYALLLTFVAIPTLMGVTAGGIRMLADYRQARSTLMSSVP